MNIMTKRGSLDNVITYEHFCDTKADLANIPKDQITLGSTAVVLRDDGDEMGIYIAGSDKEWVVVSTSSGSGAGGTTTLELIHVCSNNEYDSSTGLPTIQEPEENTIYFVPNEDEETNNLFNEYIYVNDEWEKIGNVETNFTVPTPDWDVDTYGQNGYIDNKPAIRKGTATWAIAEGRDTVASSIAAHAEGSASVASGTNSHAEGNDTVASGSSAHAEGSNTIAASNYQHVFGKYNVSSNNHTYVEIVGNGDSNARSNARTLDWSGNESLAGSLTLGKGTVDETTITAAQLKGLLSLTSANGVSF